MKKVTLESTNNNFLKKREINIEIIDANISEEEALSHVKDFIKFNKKAGAYETLSFGDVFVRKMRSCNSFIVFKKESNFFKI